VRPALLALLLLPGALQGAEPDERLLERAHQDRTIVYFLKAPETHAFELYHDYTETKPGTDHYVNVVRKGSRASDPSAVNLDTGEALAVSSLKGAAIRDAKLDIGEPVTDESEIVLAKFAPVPKGGSVRIRIRETYTDPARYRAEGDEFVWDRSLGRPRNAVVLPEGYFLTTCTIPAAVSLTEDGRVRLDFVNDRPDEIAVLIRGKKRKGP
jgi:hypothetical protein